VPADFCLITICPETPEDKAAIHHVNQEAFGQTEEADIVDRLRIRGALSVSLVAVQGNEIVGLSTRVWPGYIVNIS
jgi:predicted N-acetyltransferase YhbS